MANGVVKQCSHFGKQFTCFFKNLNTQLLYDPAIPLVSINPRETKMRLHEHLPANLHSSTVHSGQEVPRTRMSSTDAGGQGCRAERRRGDWSRKGTGTLTRERGAERDPAGGDSMHTQSSTLVVPGVGQAHGWRQEPGLFWRGGSVLTLNWHGDGHLVPQTH